MFQLILSDYQFLFNLVNQSQTNMKKHSRLLLFFVAVLGISICFSFSANAQKYIKVNGISEYKGEPLGNVEVTIMKDGEEVGKFTTDGEGDFFVELEQNANYTFRAKKKGYVCRYLVFSTHLGESQKVKRKFNFGLSMFKEGNSKNPKTAYDIPLVKYDPKTKKFQYLENF